MKVAQWLKCGDSWRASDFDGVLLGKSLDFDKFLNPYDLMKHKLRKKHLGR